MQTERKYDFIAWGITDRCNLACPHCYSSAKKSAPDELSTQECKEIIDVLSEVGLGTIGWTGGEPLLRKDLEELMLYAREKGNITSGITTNGIPLTRKRAESLKKVGLRSLQISLDGSTAEKNHKIRGARVEDFERIIASIRYCLELDLPVFLAMVISRATLDDVMDYISMARKLGVQSIRFCGYVPRGYAARDEVDKRMAISDRVCDLASLVDKMLEIESPQLLIDPAFGSLPPAYKFHKCIAGRRTFYISGNGDVYPCTGLLDDRFKVGNARERGILDILADPKMTELAVYDHDQIHGHCRECPYFRVCRGACRGAVYAHTGDLNASLPVCLYKASQDTD